MEIKLNEIIKLDNKIEYIIANVLYHVGEKYLYLSRLDKKELAIVKVVNESNKIKLCKLQEDEYKMVLGLFMKKIINGDIY